MKIYSKNKKINSVILFILVSLTSILLSGIFLYIERIFLGIDVRYHPDAAFYLKQFKTYSYLTLNDNIIVNIKNFISNIFSGKFYFSVVNLIYEIEKYHINYPILTQIFSFHRLIILVNILICALTNYLIIINYKKFFSETKFQYYLILFVFCLLPYKMHLSVNILKETLIIFLLITSVLYKNLLIQFFILIIGVSSRTLFPFYLLVTIGSNFENLKKYKLYIFIFIIFLAYSLFHALQLSNPDFNFNVIDYLKSRNLADMGGRNYDSIPNFADYDLIGIILRSIFWPFLFLTGSFIFFTKSLMMVILALEIIILQLISYYFLRKFIINIGLIAFLILVSVYVNTYTAFFRYVYPALLMAFLINFLKYKKIR